MKVLCRLFLIFILGSTALFAQSSIKAMKVFGDVSNIGPTSKAWLSANYQEIILYPKTTINIDENTTNKKNFAKKARIKIISDGKNISFLIKWADNTKNVQEDSSSIAYGDGYAIQFPTLYRDVNKLPYIDMGSSGRSVVVHQQKAIGDIFEPNRDRGIYTNIDKNNQNTFSKDLQKYLFEKKVEIMSDYQRVFISEGSLSVTQVKGDSAKVKMLYKNGYWRGTLSRSLKSSYLDLNKGAFPISFTLWDGANKNRDGIKLFSSWIGVKVVGKDGGEKFINALTSKVKGNARNGEKIALENCAACHQYKDVNIAPDFMAPNLSNIGGYSTKEYLMESIVDPSAVVVEGYSSDTHKNFTWYNINDKGSRVSIMPSYDWLDQKKRDDLVAFFKTLKAEVE